MAPLATASSSLNPAAIDSRAQHWHATSANFANPADADFSKT
jgi:hypothetical protein